MSFASFDGIRSSRKSAASCIIFLSLILSTVDRLQAEDGKINAEETLRRLIPQATAMDRTTFEKMSNPSKTPTKESFNDHSLTGELLVLDFDVVQKLKGDFRYLTKGPPQPNFLAKEIYRSMGTGKNRMLTAPVTLIHADRITNFQVNIKGTQATGRFEFRVPELYQGKAEFSAEKSDSDWQIVEFRMPALGLTIQRNEAGSWQRVKVSKEQKPQSQDDIEAAFYSPYTPKVLRICSSQEVLSLLDLSKEQEQKLSRLQEEWRNEFRKSQLDRQAFVEKWRIGTAGHRGELRRKFEAILTPEQTQTYNKIRVLWSYSPVRSDRALGAGYLTYLELRLEQQKRLLALEGKWVRSAWPHFKDARSMTGFHAISRLAWQFKEERDKVWREILTEKQAKRWKQIELQEQLLATGAARYMQSLVHKSTCMTVSFLTLIRRTRFSS